MEEVTEKATIDKSELRAVFALDSTAVPLSKIRDVYLPELHKMVDSELSKALLEHWEKVGELIIEISQEHDAPAERILLVKNGGALDDEKTMVDEIGE